MKKQVKKKYSKAERLYKRKRQFLFYKYIREKRGMSLAGADALLGYYKGWTRNLETKFPNVLIDRVYNLEIKYKITMEEAAEYKKKFPRNIKKYGELGT